MSRFLGRYALAENDSRPLRPFQKKTPGQVLTGHLRASRLPQSSGVLARCPYAAPRRFRRRAFESASCGNARLGHYEECLSRSSAQRGVFSSNEAVQWAPRKTSDVGNRTTILGAAR
jgi:hypothetical protein